MNEGNEKIIHVDFGKKVRIESGQQSASEKIATPKKVDFGADSENAELDNTPVEQEVRLVFEKEHGPSDNEIFFNFMAKVTNLPASPSSIAKSMDVVKNYSTEELKNWALTSSENDWVKKPAFFHAVLEELTSRFKEGKE